MSPPADRIDLYRIAFDEARHRIQVESATLESTRARAGIMLSAAAVVGALIARPIFEGSVSELGSGGLTALGVAVICFLVVALFTVLIWWPLDATDTLRATTILDEYIEVPNPDDLPTTLGTLTRYVDQHADGLRSKVAERLGLFSWAAAAFGVMVVLLPLVAWDAHV